jgi:hypothetical protein
MGLEVPGKEGPIAPEAAFVNLGGPPAGRL